MTQKRTHAQIKNEAKADVKNDRGTLAMARTGVVDSATAQFFINLKDNAFLNHQDETREGFGYCVFGKVTEGMDVVDKIAKVETTTVGGYENVPATPVTIKSIRKAEQSREEDPQVRNLNVESMTKPQ
jgi:peptidyl-prolyl cis-trans isomerase B (cyclophilin B)